MVFAWLCLADLGWSWPFCGPTILNLNSWLRVSISSTSQLGIFHSALVAYWHFSLWLYWPASYPKPICVFRVFCVFSPNFVYFAGVVYFVFVERGKKWAYGENRLWWPASLLEPTLTPRSPGSTRVPWNSLKSHKRKSVGNTDQSHITKNCKLRTFDTTRALSQAFFTVEDLKWLGAEWTMTKK